MNTILLDGNRKNDIARAGEILRRGGLVAIPTETVYGLAANALDPVAVKNIYAAKGRPSDNPLIVHITSFSQLAPLVAAIPESARLLAEAFWPGPLTIILPKSDLVPRETSGGLDTVAIRFPSHPVAQAVISAAGVPLAAPSANPSGRPSPTSFSHVKADLTGKVDALLDGGDCDVGVESTVLTLAGKTPRLLRPGGVTLEQLRSVLGRVDVDPAVLHRMEEGKRAASPGMKYKHYAPKGDVVLVDGSSADYVDYVNQQEGCFALCFDEDLPYLKAPAVSCGGRYDGKSQARNLFGALLRLDALGAQKIYARVPPKRGVGLAVYNRLIRAAGFQIINPRDRYLVGLTGPSGAGKSTAAAFFREAGCAVVDCDALTKDPAVYNAACVEELKDRFGADLAPDGILDRKKLGDRAFASPQGKKDLERIVFPHVLGPVEREVEKAFAAGCRIVLLDAPTLFEAGLDRRCARILTITAPREERLARIRKRDGLTGEQARLRLAAQKPESFYRDRADWVVKNAGRAGLAEALKPILDELNEGICL